MIIDRSGLPTEFPFYEMGTLHLESPLAPMPMTDHQGIGFQLASLDTRLMVIAFFHKNGDSSMFTEMGNIIVSKIANHKSAKGTQWTVSPPFALTAPHVNAYLENATDIQMETYTFRSFTESQPLHFAFIPYPQDRKIAHV